MGKADELLRSMGGTIMESASHRGTPTAMPAAPSSSTLNSDRLAGVTRSKAALDIPLARIEADPDQPREEFDDDALNRLTDSIRARGVLQPVRVRWDESRGRYVIIAGERRWRATQMAGLTTLPCVVDDRPLAPGELLAVQLVENCLREDLKPIEQAKAFRALMTLNGWSGNHLAKELGVSQSGVVQALALLDLPATVQLAVDRGELPASTAYAIATLDDPVAQAEVAGRAVSEGMSRDEVVRVVRARSLPGKGKGRGGKQKKVVTRTIRSDLGPKVTVDYSKGLDTNLIAAALANVLEHIREEQSREQAA